MSNQDNTRRTDKILAKLMNELPSDTRPHSEVQAAGHALYEFLKGIADGPVDRGAGMGEYDIWFEYGGVKMYLNLKEKRNEPT